MFLRSIFAVCLSGSSSFTNMKTNKPTRTHTHTPWHKQGVDVWWSSEVSSRLRPARLSGGRWAEWNKHRRCCFDYWPPRARPPLTWSHNFRTRTSWIPIQQDGAIFFSDMFMHLPWRQTSSSKSGNETHLLAFISLRISQFWLGFGLALKQHFYCSV